MTEQHIDPATPLDRLDMMLVASGLVESRAKAQRLIKAGHVRVDGETITKPSFMVKAGHSELAVDKGDDYVSRGAYKLLGAFETFAGNGLTGPEGLECLDIGASTGGFTDCLLQHGAAKVFAIDVGYGQLAWSIRSDPRVVTMERTNIRYVKPEDLGQPLDLSVVDVSFISLRIVLPAIRALLKPSGQVLCLIKPQFEAGKEKVGKKGVVRDPEVHRQVLDGFVELARQLEFAILGLTFSPVKGPEGNIEFLAHLTRESREGICPDTAAIVAAAHGALGG